VVVGASLTAGAAYAAGALTYQAGLHREDADAGVRSTTAVLLEATQPNRKISVRGAGPPPSPVPARWADGHGLERTGLVSAPAGQPAGSTLTVWVDTDGSVREEPWSRSNTLIRAVLATGATLLAGGLVLAGGWRLGRLLWLRRRLAAWEAEWNIVGPLWTHGR